MPYASSENKGRRTGLRVVLDTNVYISAFHAPEGVTARVVEHAADRRYTLILSPAIVQEFAHASRTYFHIEEDKIQRSIRFLAKIAKIVIPKTVPAVVKVDPSDNHILACALAGQADLIVSGDKHLRRLKIYQDISIIRPTDFLHTLEGF